MIAYLGLGSNLGDRRASLQNALASLAPLVSLQRTSTIYETEPWGYNDQPAFLNQVAEVETSLAPHMLLSYIKSIEQGLGRTPTFHYGPRQIDIDILFYGDQVVHLPNLDIPHPQLAVRAFVLVPLAELAPRFLHPVLGKPVSELLAGVDRQGVHAYTPL